ncbi:uncharacterized protein STEHIDRAFT_145413 [Stereum hirsutum FP-91666 SS1]|uniref:uncharacterized protein n=1 Tax=Stereum hirsutum (strain FP-91666) TaxID=721885 RepID=UPI000440EC29|nr:uncharacterized protein STEHIDRAFT_145413 [Stereum hirsutum FP-91666 SS1]EIM90306.1 hypothetical protein STEHIDRAFT_145413 [Stereum hirsutum FP-91666 SS1]
MVLSLDEAEFIGLFLESFIAGIFVTLACVTILTQYRTSDCKGYILPTILTMVTFAIVHLGMNFAQTFGQILPGSSGLYFLTSKGKSLFGADVFFVSFQTLLGDGILIWRCHVLYSRRFKATAFPILCFLGCFAAFIGEARSWFITSIDSEDVEIWVATYLALTLVLNIYTTLAISLWCVYNARRLEFGWRMLMPFILVFAESGALYTINVLASLVMHVRGSLGQLIAIDMQPSLVGIIYCLIILQIKFKVDLIGRRTTTTTGILDTVEINDSGISVDTQHRNSPDHFTPSAARSLNDQARVSFV